MIKIVDGVLIMKLEKGELTPGDALGAIMDRFEQIASENHELKKKIEKMTKEQMKLSMMFPN